MKKVVFILFLGMSVPCFAVTEWSTGGEQTGGTITDGLKITSADAITISGEHTVSGEAGEYSAIMFNGAGKVTVSGTLNVTGGLNFYGKTQLDVLEGATFNVVAPAGADGCRIRISRAETAANSTVDQTIVNWAGNGVWDTTGGTASVFFSAVNQPTDNVGTQYNITGGSLEIKGRNTALAFCGTTQWNISGGTLKVGADNGTVTFGGGEWSVGTPAGTIHLSGSGKMEIAGSGNFAIGNDTGNCGSLTIHLGTGSTLASSRSFVKGTSSGTRVLNLDGGTFQATDTISLQSDISTNLTKNGVTFQVDAAKTLTLNAALSCADTTNDVNRVITKTGTGTLALAADNSNATTGLLAGDVFDVQAGTLSFSEAPNLGSAGIQLNGGSLLATGTTTISNVITFGENEGRISTSKGATLTLSGVLSGTGVLDGDFILAGSQSNTGNITVAQGTVTLAITTGAAAGNITVVPGGRLLINDAQTLSGTLEMTGGKVKIADGATFTHDLTVNGATADTVSDLAGALIGNISVTQGKFSPGNSIGTIDQTGDTDFASGTTLLIEISSPTSYDVFNTTGNVNFDTGVEIEFTTELSPDLQGITFLQADSYTIDGAAVPVDFDWNTLLTDSYHWNLSMDADGNLTASIDGSTVPEPGTMWLLLLGLAFLNRRLAGKRRA